MVKQCKGCNAALPIESFYRHKQMADGYLNFCKVCVCRREINYRNRNLDRIRKYDRDRSQRPERKRYALEVQARRRASADGRLKMAARAKVRYALISGRLTRGNCEVCLSPKTEAHHDDYSKPLSVRWLCHQHHEDHHHRS